MLFPALYSPSCLTLFRAYLLANGDAAAKKAANQAGATRDDLVSAAQVAYATASKSGGNAYASVTSYLAKQTDAAREATFETWSDSGMCTDSLPRENC